MDAAYGEGDAVFVDGEGAEVGFRERRGGEAVQNCLQRFGGCCYRIKGLNQMISLFFKGRGVDGGEPFVTMLSFDGVVVGQTQ